MKMLRQLTIRAICMNFCFQLRAHLQLSVSSLKVYTIIHIDRPKITKGISNIAKDIIVPNPAAVRDLAWLFIYSIPKKSLESSVLSRDRTGDLLRVKQTL